MPHHRPPWVTPQGQMPSLEGQRPRGGRESRWHRRPPDVKQHATRSRGLLLGMAHLPPRDAYLEEDELGADGFEFAPSVDGRGLDSPGSVSGTGFLTTGPIDAYGGDGSGAAGAYRRAAPIPSAAVAAAQPRPPPSVPLGSAPLAQPPAARPAAGAARAVVNGYDDLAPTGWSGPAVAGSGPRAAPARPLPAVTHEPIASARAAPVAAAPTPAPTPAATAAPGVGSSGSGSSGAQAQLAVKVRQQAAELTEATLALAHARTYTHTVERRLLEIVPDHPVPVLDTHLGLPVTTLSRLATTAASHLLGAGAGAGAGATAASLSGSGPGGSAGFGAGVTGKATAIIASTAAHRREMADSSDAIKRLERSVSVHRPPLRFTPLLLASNVAIVARSSHRS